MLLQKFTGRSGWPRAGVALALTGIFVRARAIADCGDSFLHQIETEQPRVLVTLGVYRWLRHPSYLGFILYVVGMQMCLGNVVMYIVSLSVLWRFFSRRIVVEEWHMERLYGDAYKRYREKTAAMMPLVY